MKASAPLPAAPAPAPFRALPPLPPLVGQAEAVEALALLAVDPGLGGALLIGPPGSGRRRLAFAYAEMARGAAAGYDPLSMSRATFNRVPGPKREPGYEPASGEGPVGRVPFIETSAPLDGDTLFGSVDWEATLRHGRPVWSEGIWERARGGALYIHHGEYLDRPTCARLARRLDHPGAPVVLIGVTSPGAPDGADPIPDGLQPLAFRLAFRIVVDPMADAAEREAILQAAYGDGTASDGKLEGESTGRYAQARARLPFVSVPGAPLRALCRESARLGLANPLLDMVTLRAARARAALRGRDTVLAEDVEAAVRLVLIPRVVGIGHDGKPASPARATEQRRMGLNPPPGDGPPAGAYQQAEGSPPDTARGELPAAPETSGQAKPGVVPSPRKGAPAAGRPASGPGNPSYGLVHVYEAVEELRHRRVAERLTAPVHEFSVHRTADGRRAGHGEAGSRMHRPRRPVLSGEGSPRRGPVRRDPVHGGAGSGRLALVPSIVAALPHQPFRPPRPGLAVSLEPEDLRWYPPREHSGVLYIIVVDGSGSMGARRTRAAKGLASALLRRAYWQRARVALIRAAGSEARLVLPPSRSGLRARRALDQMATGGGTPLASALALARDVVTRYRRQHPRGDVVTLLLTDGRANVPYRPAVGSADAGPAPSSFVLQEVAELAQGLRRRGVSLVVIDRDAPGVPATDARHLADLLRCPFLAL